MRTNGTSVDSEGTFITNIQPLALENLIVSLVLLTNDITQRKRREANLAFLAGVSQDLVWLTTISETMNALGARIGGYVNASRCAFFEFNETMDGVVCEYDWHRADMPNLAGSYRTADFYTAEFQQTMRTREAFVLRDREADSRVDAMSLAALNIASLIVTPPASGRGSNAFEPKKSSLYPTDAKASFWPC